jgi:DNA-binding GntR family transcriptional regulator
LAVGGMTKVDRQQAVRATQPSPIMPQPIRRLVEDALRDAIMSGVYAPGEHLSDRALCERFGVSRSVVREAVRRLEVEGSVAVVPYRGTFVAFLSAEDAAQVYEVRAALEGLAGANFAERATNEQRTRLRLIFQELAAAGRSTDRQHLLEIKRKFYDVLLEGCGNSYVAQMLEQLLNRNTQVRATSLSAPDRLPRTVKELRRIVEAVERRDAQAAWLACRDHVHAAAAVALNILRKRSHISENVASPAKRRSRRR